MSVRATDRPTPPRALIRPQQRRALVVVLVLILALAAGVAALRGPTKLQVPHPGIVAPGTGSDPFPYRPSLATELTDRAIAGEGQALFTASPGGAVATAARVAALRPLIVSATAGTGVDPNLLEGLVFVESAGRPDAVAGGDPAGAAGLTQILPTTASTMLGLRVDLARSRHFAAQLAQAQSGGASAATIRGLRRHLMAVDQRFDPRLALAGTVRYLAQAQAHFGRADLALVSYHMGMGNLGRVLDAYDGGTAVPYVQLFFDTSPDHHGNAFALLSGFSDQSWMYYWRVLGAESVMHLYRSDRQALTRLAALQTALSSSAEVLHPPDQTPTFADPQAISSAYGDGTLVPLPSNAAQLGLRYSASIGSQARQVHAPPGLYRGLRPAALSLLVQLAARVRALAHGAAPLVLDGAVSDRSYQRVLGAQDPPAAAGWSFTLARSYVNQAQADALQAVLDRLQALNLVAWARYPGEIEVTVASDAAQAIAQGI